MNSVAHTSETSSDIASRKTSINPYQVDRGAVRYTQINGWSGAFAHKNDYEQKGFGYVKPDVAKFYIGEIVSEEFILKFENPLVFYPDIDKDLNMFCLIDARFQIRIYSESLLELRELLEDFFICAWIDFVKNKDAKLTPKAMNVRDNLIQACIEIEQQ